MGLHFDKLAGDRIVYEKDDVIGVLHNGGKAIALWDGDGESIIGHLSAESTEEQIDDALGLYRSGYQDGIEAGKIAAKASIRDALGITN